MKNITLGIVGATLVVALIGEAVALWTSKIGGPLVWNM
jgi:hypothetical protein